jgi:hypothetical protein
MMAAAEVQAFLAQSTHPLRDVAAGICVAIRTACPELGERIKWNAPSFGPGDQDRLTLNLARPDAVRLILHRGARAVDTKTGVRLLPDTQGLRWATDQRAEVAFVSAADLAARQTWLADLCQRWIAVPTD